MAAREKKQSGKKDNSTKAEIMERFKTSPFLYIGTIIILVIVVIAFVFVPILAPSGTFSGDLVFGYYNKIPIQFVPGNFFHQQYQRLAQMRQPDPSSPNYMMDMAMIWKESYEMTVIHTGILDEMKTAGYIAPESVVDREVAKLPVFQEHGRFSSARYRAMDNNTRMGIWRRVQEDIAFNMFFSDMANIKIPGEEASFVANMASPKRSFDAAVFPFTSFPDSQVGDLAQENPEMFMMIHFSRITVTSSEREARQILESVRSGIFSFEEAARSHSQDWAAERGGDMGPMIAYDLQYEQIDEPSRAMLMNLARGELSDLIPLPTGWAFFRAEETPVPANLNDANHMSMVRSYITEYSRGWIEDWLISEAERFVALARERGFDQAIAQMGMTKSSFGPISLNFGDTMLFSAINTAGVSELAGAGKDEFFWRAAFFTPPGTPASPLVIGNNVIVLFPLEENFADEDEIRSIESYFSFRALESLSHSNQQYFLNNRKLDDRFEETFWSLWF